MLVNGSATKWIKTTRGLRQGDPLPPYLFLLVAEALARMTARVAGNGLLSPVGPNDRSKVSIIQYVDDTFFFCAAKKKLIRNLLFVWQLFEWASGLKVNRSKTELYYTGPHARRGERLADALGCKVGALPIQYLGLPLRVGSLRKDDWRPIISRVEKRLERWQAKLLSQGGQLFLVNSVLANIPLYFLSVFKAPKWVLKRIESLRRAFFWTGHDKAREGQCLVAWKTVCKSKKQGGLGVLDLEGMNLALLAKWWWRLLSANNALWGNLILNLYYTRRRPLEEGRGFQPYSSWWCSVLKTKAFFKCGLSYTVGNGYRTNWWTDICLGEAPLSTLYPTIFQAVRHTDHRVKEYWGAYGWR